MHRNVAQTKTEEELKRTEAGFGEINKKDISFLVYCKLTKCGAFNKGECALNELCVDSTSICEFDSQNLNGKER